MNLLCEDMFFPNDNYGEDMVLTLQVLMKVNRVAYVAMPLYYYNLQSEASLPLRKFYA